MLTQRLLVVLSSFNRRTYTLRFLASLYSELQIAGLTARIVLVDDDSTDGTRDAVSSEYPDVEIIRGDGFLFWAGSVRQAMVELARDLDLADGILLANDDIVFLDGAVGHLHELAHSRNAIVAGAVYSSDGHLEATGGRLGKVCRPKQRLLKPNGAPQECDLLPAHSLYIPTSIYRQLGPFDSQFLHGHIDLEYSVRARKAGVRLLLADSPVATTEEVHNYQQDIVSLDLTPRELWWRLRYHPKSPPLNEGARYLRMISPLAWPLWILPYYRGHIVAMLHAARTARHVR
jgi:GT2 family glycosyltransferase